MTLTLLPANEIRYDVGNSLFPTGSRRFDLTEFEARFGSSIPLEKRADLEALLSRIEQAGVHGRGGAHFPSAVKIRSAILAGAGGTVIANAAEGEPSAAKDAALWQTNPHLVLRGLAAVGALTQAKSLGVWVHEDSYSTRSSMAGAFKERAAAEIDRLPLRAYLAPHRYVSGEASAIINAVQGGSAVPKFFPTKSRAWGEGNAPVLVFNSETLAHIGLLASSLNWAPLESTLVTLLTLNGRYVREVSSDTTFAELLEPSDQAEHVLLGGYGGQWVNWQDIAHSRVHEASLAGQGLSLGAGIVAPLPNSHCGLIETSRIVEWMASQSAQQCGPCIFGLQWLAEDIQALAAGGRKVIGALDRLNDRLPQLMKRGACSHPDGVVRMTNTALEVFASEISLHRKNKCSASSTQPFFPTESEIHAV